jgi:hypothetical protein
MMPATPEEKAKKAKRLQKDQNAIQKQRSIAQAHGFPTIHEHGLSKIHATTCGDSNCVMCGNPRKFFGERTIQEKRMFQEVEKANDKHSNGVGPVDE